MQQIQLKTIIRTGDTIRLLKFSTGIFAKIYLQSTETWYDHSPEEVMENDLVKLLLL